MAEDFIKSAKRFCGGSNVLFSLIAANIIIFFLVWAITLISGHGNSGNNITLPWLCVSSDLTVIATRPWTLLTYMVTQYDFIHLLFNVLWLYWFGIMIPERVSEKKKLLLYIGGGLTGALLFIIVNALIPTIGANGAYLCGASAAVLAVMTATAILIPEREVNLFLFGPVKFKWVALLFIVLTFIGFNGGSGAAQSAHIGGVAFGIFYGLVLRKPAKRKATHTTSASIRLRVNVKRDGNAVAKAAERLSDTNRLDELLDKIRLSGYSSLSTGERNELNLLSQRLDKK